MNLWDAEIGRFGDDLLGCPADALRRLGLRVIEETVTVYGRPLGEVFEDSTVTLYRRAVAEFRSFTGSADAVREEWDRLFADAWEWQDGRSPCTAASLCQALAQYADFLLGEAPEAPEAPQALLEVLSSCYESVLSFASLGRTVTVDAERGNPLCRRAVELQSALIRDICGAG